MNLWWRLEITSCTHRSKRPPRKNVPASSGGRHRQVDPGSIDLQVEGTTLTVTAERSVPHLENAEWAIAERPYGSYTRQLVLGRSLDTDRLEASYHDGVLTVSIPVAEKAKARKITVSRADTPVAVEGRTIEGESSERKSVES